MSGREGNDEEVGGGGWASTNWKVAGAAATTLVLWNISGKTDASMYYCIACSLMLILRDMIIHFRTAHTNEGAAAAAAWTKPKVGWVKLNVDGSLRSKGEIPSAGCGGVIRDASGEWLYGFAQKLSPSSKEDQVEKEAILRGLKWAHGKGVTKLAVESGVRKLAVESDNKGIVDKVNSGTGSAGPLILEIRKLLDDRSFWQQATLTWIDGDANKVADKLADIARELPSFDLEEFDYPPEKCRAALEKDRKAKEGDGEGGGGGGWASTLLKIGGAAVAAGVVAGGLYNVLKQPETDQVPFGAGGGSGGVHSTDQEGAAVWTKPMVGWVKLNVDGLLLPDIPSAGCGGVLRDSSGKWMDGFAQKLSPGLKVDETEKEGILRGLQWARGKGVEKLSVESDNEGIVNTVNSGFRSTDPLICNIRDLLNNRYLWHATLTSIRREANQVADKVAYNSHALTSFDHLHEYGPHSPPRNCLYALSKDAQ